MAKYFRALLISSLFLLYLGLLVTCILIVRIFENDSCQTTDPIGLKLETWLWGATILLFFLIVFVFGAIGQHYIDRFKDRNNPSEHTRDGRLNFYEHGIYTLCLIIITTFASVGYAGVGALILYRSNVKCLTDLRAIGIMSQIMIIFFGLHIIQPYIHLRKYNYDLTKPTFTK